MYELNTIYNEDCLDGMDRIQDKTIDMILCDLPYGTTACKWDTIIPLEPLWSAYNRVIKDDGAIVLTASQPFTTTLISSNLKYFRYCLVWEKEQGVNFLQAKKQPLKSHEDICIFYKKQPTYNPVMTIGKPYTRGGGGELTHYRAKRLPLTKCDGARYPKSVVKVNREYGIHPAQKPVPLFEYLIKTYTNEGETVLDNCMGSGTTAIAAINTSRKYIGFEKDETYFTLANDRIAQHNIPKE